MSETLKRRPGRPSTENGPTPTRSVRVGVVWDEAQAIARVRGETLTAVITEALHRYVECAKAGGLPRIPRGGR